MRAYFFGNMYLSSLQQGLQAAHCLAEMFIGYVHGSDKELVIHDWAINHKTMILLDGGYAEALNELFEFFRTTDFPCGRFQEEETSLNSATTSVGIILPERIYEGARIIRDSVDTGHAMAHIMENGVVYENETWTYTKVDLELMMRLNQHDLAR